MSEWSAFFAMGGYAAYVWPAYAISVLGLLAVGVVSWHQMRRSERLVALSEAPETGR